MLETPTTSVRSPAAGAADGARNVADRTACGRHRGTTVATVAPACRPVGARASGTTTSTTTTRSTAARVGRLTSSVRRRMNVQCDKTAPWTAEISVQRVCSSVGRYQLSSITAHV